MNYNVGKATRAPETHDRVPSQETERHQAVDPDLPRYIPVRRREGWSAVWPFLALVGWGVMGACWPIVPAWLRVVCIAATPVIAIAALWPMWRNER
jgi:hypothetical protein